MCVAFRIGFYSIFADSRLSAHAGFDLHLSFGSVRGWGWGMGGGGGMTSMRMQLVSSVSRLLPMCVAFRIGFYGDFADSRHFAHASLDLHLSFSSVRGWGGDGGRGDDVHANAACVFCFLRCVISRTLPVAL